MSDIPDRFDSRDRAEVLAVLVRLEACRFIFLDYDIATGGVVLQSYDGTMKVQGETMEAALQAAEASNRAKPWWREREV